MARLFAAMLVAVVAVVAAPSLVSAQVGGVAVAPVPGRVLRGFDPPASPYGPGHRGVDLSAEPGQRVSAALGGTVTFAGAVAGTGWVTVDHGGDLETTYGPLDPRLVGAGDLVAAGTPIGRLAAGASHLDWGARRADRYIDPLSLLRGAYEIHLVHPDTPLPVLPTTPTGGTLGGGVLLRPAPGPITSGFGPRVHPVTGEYRMHEGVDIAAPTGTPVVAAAAGTVVYAGAAGGYGLLVIVDHGGGLTTRYGHLSRIAVGPGDPLTGGAAIGAVGSTGLSTGPHLHFEVRVDGVAQDPLAFGV